MDIRTTIHHAFETKQYFARSESIRLTRSNAAITERLAERMPNVVEWKVNNDFSPLPASRSVNTTFMNQTTRNFAAIFLLLTCTSLHAEDRRPNILFLFTDDQPQNCLGIMGNMHIQTPNQDRLAQRGVLFNNAFVTTAICCCNRACILTGQHMVRHGIQDFITPLSAEAFDQTYPAILRKAGYRTGFSGKYAIGNPSKASRELSLPAKTCTQKDWDAQPEFIRKSLGGDGSQSRLHKVADSQNRRNPNDALEVHSLS